MKFNIKDWQDKHLIKESKLKEIDFKDKSAFDKYQAKHKMRSTTKVNVGGKDTTAGEASGEASGKDSGGDIESKIDQYLAQTNRPDGNDDDGADYNDKKGTDTSQSPEDAADAAYGAVEMMGDVLSRGDGYDVEMMGADLELLKATGISKEDAKKLLDTEMKGIEANYDADEYDGEEAYPQDTKDELYKHLDSIYGSDDGEDDENIQFDLSTNKSDDGDGLTDEDRLLNGLDAFRDGLIDKDEWDDIRDDYDEDGEYSDEDGYGEKEEKPAPVNDKPWEKSSLGTDKSFKKTQASEKRKYFSHSPTHPKWPEKESKFTHGKAMPILVKGLKDVDASNEKSIQKSIQNLESTLKAAGLYDKEFVSYEDAIKAVEDVDQSVDAKKDMKKHVEDLWNSKVDINLDLTKDESVTPRSTRIQEAKIYRTIQQLKGLEKGL